MTLEVSAHSTKHIYSDESILKAAVDNLSMSDEAITAKIRDVSAVKIKYLVDNFKSLLKTSDQDENLMKLMRLSCAQISNYMIQTALSSGYDIEIPSNMLIS